MVCDYLFCGTCFLNFRLSDITQFIEHKKRDCVANTNGYDRPSPDNLMANLLECVQCFRKFPTAWPLLMHVQVEHQLLFANAFRQASITAQNEATQLPLTMNPGEQLFDHGQAPYEPALDEPGLPTPISEDQKEPSTKTPCLSNLCTTGTQTNMSWFRTQSAVIRKRALCCVSSLESEAACTLPSSSNHTQPCTASSTPLCHCSQTQASDQGCPCQCCFSRLDSKAAACSVSIAPKSNPPSTEFPNPHINCCTERGMDDSTFPPGHTRPMCCMPTNHASSDCYQSDLALSKSKTVTVSCCPCPPAVKRSSMRSSEAQTDFEQEFCSPDYADIAMLLATPDRDAVDQLEIESLTGAANNPTWSQGSQEPSVGSSNMQQLFISPATNVVSFPTAAQPNELPLSSQNSSATLFVQPKQVDWLGITSETPRITSEDVVIFEQPLYSTTASTTRHVSSHETTLTKSVTHQFVCSECGNTYRQKVHLRKHIMTQHTGHKPYRCPNCAYTTVEKSHLTVHVRTHTGERPFVCRECDYASAQNCTLKAHYIRKHLNSRIYCSKCGEPFYTELEKANHERLCLGSHSYPYGSAAPIASHVKASVSPSRDNTVV